MDAFAAKHGLKIVPISEDIIDEVAIFLTEVFLLEKFNGVIFSQIGFNEKDQLELTKMRLLAAKEWWNDLSLVGIKEGKIVACIYGRDLHGLANPKINRFENPIIQFKGELDYEMLECVIQQYSQKGQCFLGIQFGSRIHNVDAYKMFTGTLGLK